MFDADTFVFAIKALAIASLLVELALMFGLIGLMNRMFDQGDDVWGWATCGIAFLLIADRWIGKLIPGAGLVLNIVSFVGVVVVVTFGWIHHRKYDATKRMIALTLLFLAHLAVLVGTFFFVVMSLRTLIPTPT